MLSTKYLDQVPFLVPAIAAGVLVGLIVGLVIRVVMRAGSDRRTPIFSWRNPLNWFIPVVGAFIGGAATVYGIVETAYGGRGYLSQFILERGGICSVFDCQGANVTAGPNYLCEGETVTVSWAANTALCSARNCYPLTSNSCTAASECGDPRQTCIDGQCRWSYCAYGDEDCSSPLGATQCESGAGASQTCVQPTELTVRTATTIFPAPSADPRQKGDYTYRPRQSGTIRISPGFPYWDQISPVTIWQPGVDETLRADFVCQDPDNEDYVAGWKYRLRIRGPGTQTINRSAEVTVSDTVQLSALGNGSGRALTVRLPDGAGGFTVGSLPAGGTLVSLAARNNAGDILANDATPRTGECVSDGRPSSSTTAPAPGIPQSDAANPVLPVTAVFLCVPET